MTAKVVKSRSRAPKVYQNIKLYAILDLHTGEFIKGRFKHGSASTSSLDYAIQELHSTQREAIIKFDAIMMIDEYTNLGPAGDADET